MELTVNGKTQQVDVPADMPLLWVLRDVIGLTGTKFGCGIAACGACTVHLDGQAIRSCVTPVSAVAGKQITTIEAIGDTPAGKKIQDAWLALEVAPVRLLPVGPDHVGLGAPGQEPAARATPTSTRPCRATSAAAAPTAASARPSSRRPQAPAVAAKGA